MMKLSELVISAGIAYQGEDVEITNISCNSTAIKQDGLFFAIRGTKTDGANFVPQAIQNGAVAIVAEYPIQTTVPVVVVSNIRYVMSCMANKLYASNNIKKVAVTGTNGKTSTVYYVAQIMNALGIASASVGTIGINSPLLKKTGSMTTPDTCVIHENLHQLELAGVKTVAMEASSHGLDQNRLDGITFEAGAFTNLTQDHLDYHKTMDTYWSAKIKLFDRIKNGGYAVLNADIEEFDQLKNISEQKGLHIISYGKNGDQLRILEQKPLPFGQRVSVYVFGQVYDIDLGVVGDFQLMNILCAIGLCIGLGANSDEIMQVIPFLQAPEGRLECVATLKNGASIYVDYAHTPDALERVLKTMRAHTTGRLICVFGCGGNRDVTKRPIMGKIADQLADIVYVTDDNPRFENPAEIRSQIVAACPKAIEIGDRQMAILTAVASLQENDVLVLAGKGHETGQSINGISYAFDDKIETLLAIMNVEKKPLWQFYELKAALTPDVPMGINAFGVSKDTRTLQLGDLYIAIRGDNVDGHAFVKTAVQKGACACLVDHLVEGVPVSKQIIVSDVMQAFNRLALFARNRSEAKFVAVTGSSGKTTTKEMLKLALSEQGKTYATAGNYNNHIGVPLTLTQMPLDTQYAIIETGMNHVGELTELSMLVQPDVAVVTMIGAAHLAHFQDEKQIAEAKAEIFTSMNTGASVILNADDKFYGLLRDKAYECGVRHIVSFGHEVEADFVLKNTYAIGEKTKITADWHGTELKYEIGFLGEHFAMNSLAVLAAVDSIGASVEQAALSLGIASAVAGRGAAETIQLSNGRNVILIDDAYNANPSSMAASIRSLGLRSGTVKIAVIGDMLELGEHEKELHVGLVPTLLEANVHKVYATGRLSQYLYHSLPPDRQGAWVSTADELSDVLLNELPDGAVVLIKASNGIGLKKVVMKLKGNS
ncbi:MAG: UDP-N-acetylmuramoyl-L-alanyl-D-glutamate--2,6-diaminopimelate ligase [Alphaproteobacteria bacterium]|nr:UDP-N-acetylmuramoyl-L-alanyl-D-glutamate--2,6-diaminopimelate ligase [Alphaproteobacteria bacterium]